LNAVQNYVCCVFLHTSNHRINQLLKVVLRFSVIAKSFVDWKYYDHLTYTKNYIKNCDNVNNSTAVTTQGHCVPSHYSDIHRVR